MTKIKIYFFFNNTVIDFNQYKIRVFEIVTVIEICWISRCFWIFSLFFFFARCRRSFDVVFSLLPPLLSDRLSRIVPVHVRFDLISFRLPRVFRGI